MPTFREVTLPHGLRIAAEVDPRGYSAALGYFVRTGSRDETDVEAGVSHFLEHMMFKGTARRTAADVNRELDELGGQSNAYTSEEQTVYHATVLPKYQDRLVDLLTDMLRPSLAENDFETERQVILEEIAKYEDQPPFGAFERAMERHFGVRGLGRRILGTNESIEAMTSQVMRDYFARRYSPENIVLAAAGNVDFDSLVDHVSRLTRDWGDLAKPAVPTPDDPAVLPEGISDEPIIQTPDATQAYLVRVSPAPPTNDLRRYPARLLSTIVGDESGSRFFWEMIDTGRAEACAMWTQEFGDVGAMFTYLVCHPDQMTSNRKRIDKVIRQVIRDGVSEDELTRAKNKTIASCIMQSDRPSNRLFGVGNGWQMRGEYVDLDTMLDRYRQVSMADIAQAAKESLEPAPTETYAMAAAEEVP
ncbi:MAG: M16 family metallopeptidase [Planctomycetaceae bacterium]